MPGRPSLVSGAARERLRRDESRGRKPKMASSETATDDSLYPIAVLIDELRNEDVQVCGVEGSEEAGGGERRARSGSEGEIRLCFYLR